ncbi:MAG: hypothetical protein LBS19_03675 [Clostridiales bacterium]|jgi:hypothetical protein|nr:hypothetical protein [Clostridiales bacterium]
MLKEKGLFYIGIYGGEDSESEFVKKEISDAPRFFSYHSKDSMKCKLEKFFTIITFDEFEVNRGVHAGHKRPRADEVARPQVVEYNGHVVFKGGRAWSLFIHTC